MPARLLAVSFLVLVCLVAGLAAADPLPGTGPLVFDRPLDVLMIEGIDRFALREIAASVEQRRKFWNPDYSSAEAFEKSVEPNRLHLRTIIGAVDPRVEARGLELVATTSQPALVGRGIGYSMLAVRWPVLEGVTAE